MDGDMMVKVSAHYDSCRFPAIQMPTLILHIGVTVAD